MDELTPKAIVKELDKYIIGQDSAKRSVAIALRNRYRRQRMQAELKDEVVPKNILMIGPTGVGKTEIARRLAKLVNAPFVKVEATKFTEVGYVGRDVESMVRDLVETSIRMVRSEYMRKVEDKAVAMANERLVELLVPDPSERKRMMNPFQILMGGAARNYGTDNEDSERESELIARRNAVRRNLALGELENHLVEFEVEENRMPVMEVMSPYGVEEMGINLQDVFGGLLPKRKKKRRMTVAEARKILQQEEAQKLIDLDEVTRVAIERAEQTGIIFIDEIDKIAGTGPTGGGPDISREGVQRDILPIVEGSTVMTKHGPVKTDHILFIAAGAFHTAKPSDLIPELQGRFPIRVELKSLTREDFKRILTEPENALTRQYRSLLSTDGVQLKFTDDGIDEIARIAVEVNERTEDIGARRLHTVIEKLLEDVSFAAPEGVQGEVVVDRDYVNSKLSDVVRDVDLARYIL
ncbi:MAG: ATP-dependent protease ATPase subunit HslU [Bacillota bacterium]|jgi:ATP-dependent HslUV protease ATP-binding subunit HslU|nr:ATP-dependent protease ATPase subunit HslU [Bacillota bacterium]HOB91805.1 ATP-dependent protease ATPase subunit HslU [Bacillota bacterium]HPZ53938.1 ATP-dependent protease ATPase subunit HslU [Bacillota bacterium]HQD18122.1 ATP-dependent protease ATPase subunit HslU [Bacillota bacterium]